jgi:predicted nucleic acid-binding protein
MEAVRRRSGLERYLVDTSAASRIRTPYVRARLQPLLDARIVDTCGVTDLELLYSARSAADYEHILRTRRRLDTLPINDAVLDRALEVQHQLARRGQHRLSIIDLIVAATAELADVAVLHYDADFERIAEVTGQRHQWVAPRGML